MPTGVIVGRAEQRGSESFVFEGGPLKWRADKLSTRHRDTRAAMKNLFDPAQLKDVKQRISCLRPDSERHWGKMPITLMITHCTFGFQMAMGVINPRRASFPGNVIGLLIKPIVFGNDKPMRRNSPSVPELFAQVSTESEFERERNRLTETVDKFASMGEAGCSRNPHPFFGPLKPHQWAILMYKHIDHHLSQFGV